jgi:syndecan 4
LDVAGKSDVFSKNFEIKDLNETTTIKNLAISFKDKVITISIDCQSVAEQKVDFKLSEIYESMEEPSVKLFRERKYPLYVELEFEDCEKVLKKQTDLLRKMNKKAKKLDGMSKEFYATIFS